MLLLEDVSPSTEQTIAKLFKVVKHQENLFEYLVRYVNPTAEWEGKCHQADSKYWEGEKQCNILQTLEVVYAVREFQGQG
jgi:hypothetical protein